MVINAENDQSSTNLGCSPTLPRLYSYQQHRLHRLPSHSTCTGIYKYVEEEKDPHRIFRRIFFHFDRIQNSDSAWFHFYLTCLVKGTVLLLSRPGLTSAWSRYCRLRLQLRINILTFCSVKFSLKLFFLSLSQLLHHFYLKRVKIPILDFSFFNVNSVSVAEPKPVHFGWSRSRCEGQAPAAP